MQQRSATNRPGVALIGNCMTPYRANLHSLLAESLPELRLHTLITHGPAEFDWSMQIPAEINTSYFNYPGDSPLAQFYAAPMQEWRKGGRLIDYLRAHNVRAVICAGYRYLSYLRVIGHCYRSGLPLFVQNDSSIKCDDLLPPPKRILKRQVYNWWVPRVSGIMSMGEYGDEFFVKYGAKPQRIYRVPYTPNYEQFMQIDLAHRAELMRTLGLDDSRRRIMYSGRLVSAKRVDLLIDAFVAIAPRRPDWDLLIVGDGVLADRLRGRVPESLRNRITWAGFLDRNDLIAAYHCADVLVLPSDYEPWAVVIQEAMSAGLAVIASDVVGAAHELVRDGASGRIFPAGNLAALEAAILDVTDETHLALYRQQSQTALAEWRRRVDPIAEVRRALADVGVLESAAIPPLDSSGPRESQDSSVLRTNSAPHEKF